MRRQLIRKWPQVLVFFLELIKKVQNNTPTRPSVSLDRAVRRLLLDLGRHPILRPAFVIDLLILILHLQSDIEVNNLQTKGLINEKIVGLDVPMGNRKPMKIPEAFDEVFAESIDLARELLRSDPKVICYGIHFGHYDPQPGLRVERIEQSDNVYGLWLSGIKEIEDHELIRFLANFLRDEFLAWVRWSKHSENMSRHLGFGGQRGVS